MTTVRPKEFLELLDGVTKPALFMTPEAAWVVRYTRPRDPDHLLRLSSELVGYRIAARVGLRVPRLVLVRVEESFTPPGASDPIAAGIGPATEHVQGARRVSLDRKPLAPFWRDDEYLMIHAGMCAVDTWVMNYDRRKEGNVLLTGDTMHPAVYCVDFDRAFHSPGSGTAPPTHWMSAGFDERSLYDKELLSGVTGCTERQGRRHFLPWFERIVGVTPEYLENVLEEIPAEWLPTGEARRRWLDYLLRRREVTLEILAPFLAA